ncbi:fatty acid desaturase [Oleiphilus messinensis]|uniref:Fatty acid desaturase n=1 Tax=Oleiphilus messinensis TaxID=141451 RepID=A0A1Y0IFE0_9GAMM|nr:acyl-CoA desaturase [Oleiphilus messinensis]ARU58215.1 fatty acid desaturase [Oleiphilus messinensis]
MHTLSNEQFDQLAQELDEVKGRVLQRVGQQDADYIRRMIRIQRFSEIFGRISLVLGFLHWSFWIVGVGLLALAKILDNMEIGHNVLHGQYDWMNDPYINSNTFEWDNVCDSQSWKRTHNFEHHTYTNILGKDRDFGYGIFRLTNEYRWKPKNIWQFFSYMTLSILFEWGVAFHELAGRRVFFGKKKEGEKHFVSDQELKSAFYRKSSRQVFKDYIFFPLISGPMFIPVLLGNLTANLIRNLWTSTIIFCGHFTEGVHVFKEEDCANESRGQWYYRQMLGSSNLQGPKWFHILTGHLSCQIEHHLFPDIPAPRYIEVAPDVQRIAAKYGIEYNTGSFWKQYGTVLKRIIRHSFPDRGQPAMAS